MAGKRFKSNQNDRARHRSAPRPEPAEPPKYADLFDGFDDFEEAAGSAAETDAFNDLLDAALENEERADLTGEIPAVSARSAVIAAEASVTRAPERPAGRTSPKPEKAKRSKKSIVFAILSLLLSLVFILVGIAALYAGNLLNRFQFITPVHPNSSGGNSGGQQTAPIVIDVPTQPGKSGPEDVQISFNDPVQIDGLYHDDAIINILLLGTDDYVGDQGRSDSMMLVSIDRRHQKLKVTSFMRDMYVDLSGGWAPNRINVAYFLGGPDCLVNTIEDNFKIDIDRYVVVTYYAFEKIVDALGGVEMELSAAEAAYINQESGETNAYAVEGLNLLTGKQARMYARTRKIGNGDFERTSRQRNIFSSIVKKLKGASIFTLTQIANEVVPEISTDFSQEEMVGLLMNGTTYFNYEVQQARIPSDEFYYNDAVIISGYESYVLVPDTEWNSIYANDFIYGDDFPELGATLDHYGYKHAIDSGN